MAVGDSSLHGFGSYVAIGRETTTGTYSTCTAALPVLSSSLRTQQESQILEQIDRSRTYAKQVKLGKVVEGDLEFYYVPKDDAHNYLLQNAIGGAIASATATGETAGGTAFTHTLSLGDLQATYSSLCMNVRKGAASGGKIWEYNGVKVSQLNIAGEIDQPLMMNASLVCKDETQTTNDIESALTFSASDCLNFVNGRFSVESTFAALTSSSYWHVQSVNFSLINNLKTDSESRRIGTDTLDVLPRGVAQFELSVGIRFNTTTAYDAMKAETAFSAEFEFLGSTIGTSVIRQGLKLQFPKIRVSVSDEPEIGGPDEILSGEISFNVLRDDSSAAGYAVRALVTNSTTSY